MINKRLLIKNLLAHHNENSFYDLKRQLNLHNKEGKSKFLKHICALSNANPLNHSYLVVGIEDESQEIVGVDFFDDSRIQNLVNAFLENPPKIVYENVPFPHLSKDKVVGLVSITPPIGSTYFKKNIHLITAGSSFIRMGSTSVPVVSQDQLTHFRKNLPSNAALVSAIENQARNSISHTLAEVMDFMMHRHKGMKTEYRVFKELFVVCWAGYQKKVRDRILYSRVDIELINEQIKLFYSAFDEVSISYTDDYFRITEFVPLGLNDRTSYYPLEELTIRFLENGQYSVESQFLFEPPQYNPRMMHHIYNAQMSLLKKLETKTPLNSREMRDLERLPSTLMLCYLNGFDRSKELLVASKELFKKVENIEVYSNFKETMRILRKIKYDSETVIPSNRLV
jgi:hypothetical protein